MIFKYITVQYVVRSSRYFLFIITTAGLHNKVFHQIAAVWRYMVCVQFRFTNDGCPTGRVLRQINYS